MIAMILACAFCTTDVIEKQMVTSNELASVLIDYKPVTNRHLLVIPNRHVERFEDLTHEELSAMFALIQEVHRPGEQYFLLQKNGPMAGQSVPHVHFHYVGTEKQLGPLFSLKMLLAEWWPALNDDAIEKAVADARQ